MPFRKGEIDIISMGCSKNLIDSERLIKRLEKKGYKVRHNPENPKGEYVVVNTCGFIGDAKEESISMILNLAELKKKRHIGSIVVMGCLAERYKESLPKEMPEVDIWYGKFDWNNFIENLPDLSSNPYPLKDWERKLTTPPWSAYLKVSEGCNRHCAYCAIPLITGRHKSRNMNEILEEVKSLVKDGVKEFNVIAQDLSSYGLDIYGIKKLPELIDRMARIDGVEWIRLHYLYPTDFPMEILDVMCRHENVCKYLDIPLQHISDTVLKNMKRGISKKETIELLNTIREKVPGIHLRTTIMTGFPGEGEKEFEELKEFVEQQKFERLGGFAYCEEEDTLAAKTLEDIVSEEIKESRLAGIMDVQEEISRNFNARMIGKEIKVLVEEKRDGICVGRSEYDSPEVDQEVIIEDCDARPGSFINVKITGADTFELFGRETKK